MKRIIDTILSNKVLFSGIAIFIILLYHQPMSGVIKGIYFYPGFSGVDIFLFFSGYGLCYSLNKNSLSEFYKRRFLRILPLYMLLGLIVGLLHFKEYNIWDYVCNMTSLSYWGLGGNEFEWYLSSLFIFYLAFPFLYWAIVKWPSRATWGGYLFVIWIIVLAVFAAFDLAFYYETFIGRVPIFLLGIMCYKDRGFFKQGLIVFTAFLIPAIFLYMKGLIHTYTLIYCLGPVIILIIALIVPFVKSKVILNKCFSWMGKRSLEIYVANSIICICLSSILSGWTMTITYWLLHFPVVQIICRLNNSIANVINRNSINQK